MPGEQVTPAQVESPGEGVDVFDAMAPTNPCTSIIYFSTLAPIFAGSDPSEDQLRQQKRDFKEKYRAKYPLGHQGPGPRKADLCFYLCELPALVPLLLYDFAAPAGWQTRLCEAISQTLLWKDADTWFVLGTEYWQPYPQVRKAPLPDDPNGVKHNWLTFRIPEQLKFQLKDLCSTSFWGKCNRRRAVNFAHVVDQAPCQSGFDNHRDIRTALVRVLTSDTSLVDRGFKSRHIEFIANTSVEVAFQYYQKHLKQEQRLTRGAPARFISREQYFQTPKRQRVNETDDDNELQWNPSLYVKILDRCLSGQLPGSKPTWAMVQRAILEEFRADLPYLEHSAYAETAGIYPEIRRLSRDCTFLVG